MSALEEFSNWVKAVGPSAAAAVRPGSATVSNDAAPVKSQSASRQAEVTKRLAALIRPYKESVSQNGPVAAQMQSHMAAAKKHIIERNFEQAAKDLDELAPLVEQAKSLNTNGGRADAAAKAGAASPDPAFVRAGTPAPAAMIQGPVPVLQTNSIGADPDGGTVSEIWPSPLSEHAGPDRGYLQSGDQSQPLNRSSIIDQFTSSERSADSNLGHPRIYRVGRDDPRFDNDVVKLPTTHDDLVTLRNTEEGFTKQVKRSEVLKWDNYVDNGIASLKVRIIDPYSLKVGPMQISYSDGRTTSVPLKSVLDGARPQATRFVYKHGFINPVDEAWKDAFDNNNTPNIVLCSQWVRQQLLRISQDRLQIAEIVAAFASIVAGLGGAAGGVPHVSGGGGGHPSPSTRVTRRGADGGRPEPAGGGGRRPGTSQNVDSPPTSGRLNETSGGKVRTTGGAGGSDKPSGSGGTGGGGPRKPTGGDGGTGGGSGRSGETGGGQGKPTGGGGGSGGGGGKSRGAGGSAKPTRAPSEIAREIDGLKQVEKDIVKKGADKTAIPGTNPHLTPDLVAAKKDIKAKLKGLVAKGDQEAQKILDELEGIEKRVRDAHKELDLAKRSQAPPDTPKGDHPGGGKK